MNSLTVTSRASAPLYHLAGGSVSTPYGSTFASSFSDYDMIRDKGRRRAPRLGKTSESVVLPQRKRDKAQGTIYDLIRNDITARWAFNKYLDYTTTFYFQSNTGNAEFDDAFEEAMRWYSLRENCDVCGRHDLARMIRMFGSCMGMDGDAAILKVNDDTHKYKLQGIEADRIHEPSTRFAGTVPDEYRGLITSDGVIMDECGAVAAYIICNRDGRSYTFARAAGNDELIFDGHFFRFDQIRGVSPFAAALNKFQDIYEIDEYQLIKCKKHAMHGIFFKSADTGSTGFGEYSFNPEATNPLTGETATASTTDADAPRYQFELDAGLKIEGLPGDSVEMFESKNPSNEYQSYSELMLRKGFLSFAIPYSFFDSRQSSYSAAKQDRVEFIISIKPHRLMLKHALEEITRWVTPFLLDKFKLTPPDNIDPELLPYEWIPEAEPWLDENAEVDAAGKRIALGLSNQEIECRKRGLNAYDVARGNKRYQSYAQKAGIKVAIGMPGQTMLNDDADQPKPTPPNKSTNEDVNE